VVVHVVVAVAREVIAVAAAMAPLHVVLGMARLRKEEIAASTTTTIVVCLLQMMMIVQGVKCASRKATPLIVVGTGLMRTMSQIQSLSL